MRTNQPLVSIGIPTYNRADLLKRSVESALNQDYENVEILISDNASTDETERVCQYYCQQDARVKYIGHAVNRGSVKNFSDVLHDATGSFFMWLGDDDWLDPDYVSECINQLMNDQAVSLVSGAPKYYRSGIKFYDGKVFSLLNNLWWLRMISYYWQVADNGMFYGLMRTHQIRQLKMPNVMGGDWLLIANIAFIGKVKVISGVSVHRELGGATASYMNIVASLGLPKIQGVFPMTSIACGASLDFVKNNIMYQSRPAFVRVVFGCIIFFVIMAKATLSSVRTALAYFKSYILRQVR